MEIRKVTAAYFSPAGTTGDVTEMIASVIGEAFSIPVEIDDFTLPSSRGVKRTYGPDELVVFGTPTYAGRVPNKIMPFIRESFSGDQTPAVCCVTFGNRAFDSSLAELWTIAQDGGFRPFAGAACVSRHVFSEKIAAGRPDDPDRQILIDLANNAVRRLQEAESPEELPVPDTFAGEINVGPYYIPRGADGAPAKFLKAKPKTDRKLCTRCGRCARACPMGIIPEKDPTAAEGACIKCQACVLVCPEHAKYFDDPAFLSHVEMLEKNFTRSARTEVFI
jgi:ferredoxin/flavodoxin